MCTYHFCQVYCCTSSNDIKHCQIVLYGGEQVPPWTIGAQVRLLFPHTTQQSGLGGILMDITAGNVYSNCSMIIGRGRTHN